MSITAVILAAGKGKRMNSALPKVLHAVGGFPMLYHVIKAAEASNVDRSVIVYGHGGDQVQQAIALNNLDWVEQTEQLGTAHAVKQALPKIDPQNLVIVLFGDCPLLSSDTIKQLISSHISADQLSVLTFNAKDPTGYGRIVRNDRNEVEKIVEHKDATDSELKIKEVNSGVMLATAERFATWINQISANNQQKEYYLTDCVAIARREGSDVIAVNCENANELRGVNDRIQLAEVEMLYQNKQRAKLALEGMTFLDPNTVYINGKVETGRDVIVGPGVEFYGNVKIGDEIIIESNCRITDSLIHSHSIIHSMSHIENATIGKHCEIGPFARLRPDTQLKAKVKIGNFVEVKKATIEQNSKVNHLSYIGDCIMGENVNVGAGTITCNYDGANKHQTIIGDDVFIGSDTQIVAPITIEKGSTIGAGSTITRNVGEGSLALSRVSQTSIENWQRPRKSK